MNQTLIPLTVYNSRYMLTLQLRRPFPFAKACWKINELTEDCNSKCARNFWAKQANLDLGVSLEYFNLGRGERERYIEIASRWYSLPGSEIYIDQGASQLFAARDEDKCSLIHLITLPYENWSNMLIGAALSGNYNFFVSILNLRFSTFTNLGGIQALYNNYPQIFKQRLQLAGALGGSEEIFKFCVPDLNFDINALALGANLKPLERILRKKKLTQSEINELYRHAFLSGKQEVLDFLTRYFPLKVFVKEAASSGLHEYTDNSVETYLGYAKAGNIDILRKLDKDRHFWTQVIEEATDSTSPLRWDIVKLALERGGEITKTSKENAVLTGDIDLAILVKADDPKFLSFAVETGNLQMVKRFHAKSIKLSTYAGQLGFGEISILLQKDKV